MKIFFLFEFAVNMLFFVFLGYLADQYWLAPQFQENASLLHTSTTLGRSWGILAGLLIGFGYALYSLLRRINQ